MRINDNTGLQVLVVADAENGTVRVESHDDWVHGRECIKIHMTVPMDGPNIGLAFKMAAQIVVDFATSQPGSILDAMGDGFEA